jgi:hypothetical protein
MKRIFIMANLLIFSLSIIILGQIDYPFLDTEGDRDIQAYWYNIPEVSAERDLSGNKHIFQSFLQIYGKVPADFFSVQAHVFSQDGKELYEHIFTVKKGEKNESFDISFIKDYFKITYAANFLEQRPERIIVTIQTTKEKRSKEIKCRYHKLHGRVTDFDGKPMKAYVAVSPDSFFPNKCIGVVCDSSGSFEIELPERTYNAIIADCETYGEKTLESWAWHIIMDSEQHLDFKIGTGEVYNLNVWSNNGGGNSYFVSFRPMVLFKLNRLPITINSKEFILSDAAPDLLPDDITITVNGKEAEIISLQKYHETGSPGRAITAYLVQIDKKGLDSSGKQTVMVEYQKEIEIEGKRVLCTSIGYFQFYLNYSGLSKYF